MLSGCVECLTTDLTCACSEAFRLMCKTIDIIELHEAHDIVPAYQKALERSDGKSTMLVEFSDYLKTKWEF